MVAALKKNVGEISGHSFCMSWMLGCAWRGAERATWEFSDTSENLVRKNLVKILKKGVCILAQKDSDRKRHLFPPIWEYRGKCRGVEQREIGGVD